MKSNFPNIDYELEKRNMHYRDLAAVAGISDQQMYRRLKGQSDWKLPEIMEICWFFGHPNVHTLFTRR